MTASEIQYQASKLADYVRRGGDRERWLSSKSFTPGERAAIEAECAPATPPVAAGREAR